MACRICGRSSCSESFHSIDAQERFDARERISDELADLKERAEKAERERDEARKELAVLRLAYGAAVQRLQALGEKSVPLAPEADKRSETGEKP